MRIDLISKRNAEWFKDTFNRYIINNKFKNEEMLENEFVSFKDFFIDEINQLTTKLTEETIKNICKIVNCFEYRNYNELKYR